MPNYNIHRPDPDPHRPRYVVMNNAKTSVLMTPLGGRGGKPVVWWSYKKSEAELMLKILEKDYGNRGFVIEYRQAIVVLCNHHAALAEQLKKEEQDAQGMSD